MLKIYLLLGISCFSSIAFKMSLLAWLFSLSMWITKPKKKHTKLTGGSHSGICYISTILYLYKYLFLETHATLLVRLGKESSAGNQNQI